MQAAEKLTPSETLHRLLHRALVEIRFQGHEQQDKLVYHLANLFHAVVLEMGAAAGGRSSYDAALRRLEETARETGCERWLAAARADLTAEPIETGM